MSVVLESNPVKTTNAILSNVNAGRSQLPYNLTRKDFIISAWGDGSGSLLITITDTASFELGGTVHIVDTIHNQRAIITAITATTLTLDIPWTFTGVTGYVNNITGYQNYKINVRILDENDVALVDLTFLYSPRPDGLLFLDVSQILIDIHEDLSLLTIDYKLAYGESYNGAVQGSETIDEVVMSLYSARQILKQAGSNMFDRLPQLTTLPTILTKFEKPIVWKNWKRQVASIYDVNYPTRAGDATMKFRYSSLDVNKMNEANASFSDDVITPVGIFLFTIPETAKDDYYARVILQSGLSAAVTTEQIFEVREECTKPVMVEWLNQLGGIEQHLFNIDAQVSNSTEVGNIFERAINEDQEFVARTKTRTARVSVQTWRLVTEKVTRDQYLALIEIQASPIVRVWLTRDGTEFVEVVVSGGYVKSFTTRANTFDFALQLDMPDNFDLIDGVKYNKLAFEGLIDQGGDDLIDLGNDFLIG